MIEKERKKCKSFEKEKIRVWNYVVLISDVCWCETCDKEEVWLKFYCLKLCGSNYSLRFRHVFVSISFRTYHLFVYPTILQPWKALEILSFIFPMQIFRWMLNLVYCLQDCWMSENTLFLCVFHISMIVFAWCDSVVN